MPACAALWAIPRPMTPVPTTARLRSGRETSRGMSLGEKRQFYRGSRGIHAPALTFARDFGKLRAAASSRRFILPGEEPHAFSGTYARAARADRGSAGRGAGIPLPPDHADLPLAARPLDRHPPAALRRDRNPHP